MKTKKKKERKKKKSELQTLRKEIEKLKKQAANVDIILLALSKHVINVDNACQDHINPKRF